MFVGYIETDFILKIWYKDVLYLFTAAAATHTAVAASSWIMRIVQDF